MPIVSLKIACLIKRNNLAEAEKLGEEWLALEAPTERKIAICDVMASSLLDEGRKELFGAAERWIQRGLALDPNDRNIKATLGGYNVETGQYSRAEPLLKDHLHHGPRQAKNVTRFYLALISERNGELHEALGLLEAAASEEGPEWLMTRAKEKTAEILERINR
jgi:hypothetical protein